MGRASLVVLALSLVGCLTPAGLGCPDADGDGRCDADGPCSPERGGDVDGDGVCGDVDACPGHPDDEDEDDDGVPDGCDPCPGDPENDEDGDGICAADDPCPDRPGTDCAVTVWLAVQVDWFHGEATWQVVDHRSSIVAYGGFDGPGDGAYHEFTVRPDRATCVTLRDGGRDGGIRGMVFQLRPNRRFATWDADDYGSGHSVCFTPRDDGKAFTPPVEEAWLQGGACDVELAVDPGVVPTDVGWRLETGAGRELVSVATGTYGSAALQTRTLRLTGGRYVLRVYDAEGDGWAGDGASWSVRFAGSGDPIADGTLDGDFEEGWFEFVVACP